MAKMKVHELAKEVDRKSKELIDFLQAKGYEVKVAQSSIEDEAIALVRKEFGSSGQTEDKIAVKEPAVQAEKPKKESPGKENSEQGKRSSPRRKESSS